MEWRNAGRGQGGCACNANRVSVGERMVQTGIREARANGRHREFGSGNVPRLQQLGGGPGRNCRQVAAAAACGIRNTPRGQRGCELLTAQG
jgi:hypothetical protein